MICALDAALHIAQAIQRHVNDAIGSAVVIDSPAQRVIVGFNFEAFTAVGGADARIAWWG